MWLDMKPSCKKGISNTIILIPKIYDRRYLRPKEKNLTLLHSWINLALNHFINYYIYSHRQRLLEALNNEVSFYSKQRWMQRILTFKRCQEQGIIEGSVLNETLYYKERTLAQRILWNREQRMWKQKDRMNDHQIPSSNHDTPWQS